MGLYRTNGHRNNKTQRLAILAAELTPKRPPWWVSQPAGRTPSQGWWWIPQDSDYPAFLGHSNIIAETALRALIDAHYVTQ